MLILLPSVITHSHNTSLALAAIVVSIVAAITGLALMNNIRTLPEPRRKAVIVMAAFLLGGGIWSMHFLAMLSIQFPVPVHYDFLQTLSSGLIAVLVVGFALLLLHFRTRTPLVLNTAGLCLGIGIISMHVVGMLGMRGVIPVFSVIALLLAFILALVMGVAAIRVSYGSRSRQNIVKGGVLFGLSVVVVHFTAMIGTHFSIDPDYQTPAIALDQGALAIMVTVAAFVICGTFLLAASTFVPPAEPETQGLRGGKNVNSNHSSEVPIENVAIEQNVPNSEQLQAKGQDLGISLDSEQNTLQPATIESTTGPETRTQPANGLASSSLMGRHNASVAQPQPSSETVAKHPEAALPVKIPYEQRKQIFFVESDQVGAIRADGRYTQLYTRDGVKFCPWSITEAETRLVGARFYRSHRSYLVNMLAVASFEKNRDSGVCRFEGFTHLGNVPVSRARVSELVSELGL